MLGKAQAKRMFGIVLLLLMPAISADDTDNADLILKRAQTLLDASLDPALNDAGTGLLRDALVELQPLVMQDSYAALRLQLQILERLRYFDASAVQEYLRSSQRLAELSGDVRPLFDMLLNLEFVYEDPVYGAACQNCEWTAGLLAQIAERTDEPYYRISAAALLSELFERGHVSGDPLPWLRLAAETNTTGLAAKLSLPKLQLALRYRFGVGVAQNEDEALRWLDVAANAGVEEALLLLALHDRLAREKGLDHAIARLEPFSESPLLRPLLDDFRDERASVARSADYRFNEALLRNTYRSDAANYRLDDNEPRRNPDYLQLIFRFVEKYLANRSNQH